MELVLSATIQYTLILAASEIQRRHRRKMLERFLEGSLTYEELLRLKKTGWFKRLYKEAPMVDTNKKNE